MLSVYEQHSKRKLLTTILSVLVIAGAVIFADYIKNTHQVAGSAPTQSSAVTKVAASTTPITSSSALSNSPPASTNAYKNGSYTASSSYYVPHSTETIDVSLSLKDGVIADVAIQNSESDHVSAQYQKDFAAVYKSYVVGKKLNELQLGIVAGASDTTQGFDDALSQIASKAQA